MYPPANPWMMKLYSIVNENLVTLCGIGLIPSSGLDPNDVIAENVNKLKSRYLGEFHAYYPRKPKENDP